jgi:RimJ/RimL family protein N-acetyltransferase
VTDTPTPDIETARLRLTALRPEDAAEMVEVLADPSQYVFIGGQPPTLDELETRYRSWDEGSPRSSESWCNWIVRLHAGGEAIGHVQATVVEDRASADIAWVIGPQWQGRGYATEAARALVEWLSGDGVTTVTAHIHADNVASGQVAANAGLEPTDGIDDGEVVWQLIASAYSRHDR